MPPHYLPTVADAYPNIGQQDAFVVVVFPRPSVWVSGRFALSYVHDSLTPARLRVVLLPAWS